MEFVFLIVVFLFLTISWWGPWFEKPSTYTPPEPYVPPAVDHTVARQYVLATMAKGKGLPYNQSHLDVYKKKKPAAPEPTVVIPVATTKPIVKNMAPNPRDTSWFVCNRKDLPAPSAAEEIIIALLNLYSVRWYREISFYGLQFTSYSYPRYDFYIPKMNMILEYDGQAYHGADDKLAIDRAKDKFCKDNGIGIIRWNRKHYYHLGRHVEELMAEYGIKKKPARPENR